MVSVDARERLDMAKKLEADATDEGATHNFEKLQKRKFDVPLPFFSFLSIVIQIGAGEAAWVARRAVCNASNRKDGG